MDGNNNIIVDGDNLLRWLKMYSAIKDPASCSAPALRLARSIHNCSFNHRTCGVHMALHIYLHGLRSCMQASRAMYSCNYGILCPGQVLLIKVRGTCYGSGVSVDVALLP